MWTCIAAIAAVVTDAAWQWRAAGQFGWSGLDVRVVTEVSDEGRRQETRIVVKDVEPLSPASAAGFRRGERIVALNGTGERLGERVRNLRAGEPALLFTDSGAERCLRMVPPWHRPSVFAVLAINAAAGLLALLIGALAYGRKPDDSRTLILLALSTLYAVVRFTALGPVHRYGLDPSANLLQVLSYIWAGVLFFPVLLHFFLVFPRRDPLLDAASYRVRRLYSPAVALGLGASVCLIVLVRLYPAESPQLADAVAAIGSAWPALARYEGWVLLVASVLAASVAVYMTRVSLHEFRANRWTGLLLHAPTTAVPAAASWLLLASVAVRAVDVLSGPGGTAATTALVLAAAGIGVCVAGTLATLWITYPVAACLALWRSYRGSSNVEKRQLRWPLFGTVLGVAGYLLTEALFRLVLWLWVADADGMAALLLYHLRQQLPGLALLLIPLSIAFAVLRYRLLDIDIFVRRTIIYGSASGLLGCLFVLIVAASGRLLAGLFEESGQWAAVGATLAAGMLFIPIRARVQQAVDRRFYRRRNYPAALSRLAAHTDLQAATDVIQEAIPSRSAALWLASRDAPVLRLCAATGGIDAYPDRTLPLGEAAETLRTESEYLVEVRRGTTAAGYLAIGPKLAETAWDNEDRDFLEAAAAQMGMIAASDPAEEEQAAAIQRALLPTALPDTPGVCAFGLWQPARVVGGDYYDVIRIGETRLGLAIADVAGKGIAAALLMSNVQAALRLLAAETDAPETLCARLNALVCANVVPGRFVTFFYAVLDLRAATVTYCNAGHNPPLLLLHPGAAPARLEVGGLPLGIFPSASYVSGSERVRPGTRLILYTDGVCDACDVQGEAFGEERLIALLQEHAEAETESLPALIQKEVNSHCGGVFSDDVTILAVGLREAAASARV